MLRRRSRAWSGHAHETEKEAVAWSAAPGTGDPIPESPTHPDRAVPAGTLPPPDQESGQLQRWEDDGGRAAD